LQFTETTKNSQFLSTTKLHPSGEADMFSFTLKKAFSTAVFRFIGCFGFLFGWSVGVWSLEKSTNSHRGCSGFRLFVLI